MNDDLRDLILFRMKESKEALNDSKLLLDKASYRASVNRSYYSMFYAMVCLSYSIGVESSKHTHVISTFDKEFVKTRKFSKETSKWVHDAFKKRQESDYLDFKEVKKEESEIIYNNAEKFIELVASYFYENFGLFFM